MKSGRPAKSRFVVERERDRLFVGEHVLAERRAEGGKARGDFGKPRLGRRIERGAGAAEGDVIALENAHLLGAKAERAGLLHQRVDAGEQFRVGVNVVPMSCHHRRDLALDRLQRVIGVGAGKHMEHMLDPRQRPAAALQRLDRIGEARRRGLSRDRRDFGGVLRAGARIGLAKVLGLDAIERGNAVGGGPGCEKGVFGRVGSSHCRIIPNEWTEGI